MLYENGIECLMTNVFDVLYVCGINCRVKYKQNYLI